MTRMNFGHHSGIIVDVCREHGTWFDQDELASAMEFVRTGGLDGEGESQPDPAPTSNDQAATRMVEAALSAEAKRDAHSVEAAARIADDLLLTVRVLHPIHPTQSVDYLEQFGRLPQASNSTVPPPSVHR